MGGVQKLQHSNKIRTVGLEKKNTHIRKLSCFSNNKKCEPKAKFTLSESVDAWVQPLVQLFANHFLGHKKNLFMDCTCG